MKDEPMFFKPGHRCTSLDGVHWVYSESPMGAFIDCWAFLEWVMRGCPPAPVVTKVDRESGTITIETPWMRVPE